MCEIYALIDPVTDETRYIGKAKDSRLRLKMHMRDRMRRDYPVYRWINKLADQGLMPKLLVLEVAENWQEAECRLIELSRARGCRLLNVAEGGSEPYCSHEQRSENGKKLNAALRSNPEMNRIREIKRYLICAIKSGYVSNEARAKLRLAAAKRPDMFGIFSTIPNRAE